MTKWLDRERWPEVFVNNDKFTPLAETRHRECAFSASFSLLDCRIACFCCIYVITMIIWNVSCRSYFTLYAPFLHRPKWLLVVSTVAESAYTRFAVS